MSKAPTRSQRAKWEILREGGCYICQASWPSIHHLFTGMGGRKDHDKVAALCYYHHQGEAGIHTLGRREFAERFKSEAELMEITHQRLGN